MDETAKALNNLGRHQMICRLLKDILIDLTVCQLEGWPPDEYINILKGEIDNLLAKFKTGATTEQSALKHVSLFNF